jgi:hypothetical protein
MAGGHSRNGQGGLQTSSKTHSESMFQNNNNIHSLINIG